MASFKTEAKAIEAAAASIVEVKVVELYTGVWILEEVNPAPQPSMSRARAMRSIYR